MKMLIAAGAAALMLTGCTAQPTWNTAVFPEQPVYDPTAAVTDTKQAAK